MSFENESDQWTEWPDTFQTPSRAPRLAVRLILREMIRLWVGGWSHLENRGSLWTTWKLKYKVRCNRCYDEAGLIGIFLRILRWDVRPKPNYS